MIGAYPQLFRVLDYLGHANPNQNILELGASTGGATRVAMKALGDANGIKRYSGYAFTDISPDFLIAAREFMAAFNNVSFSALNIEEDPLEQEHGPVYDVVIASQCLHATPDSVITLANCRKLLKHGGKLVLVKNTQDAIGHGLLLGTLTGYWDGVPDGRVDSPFLDLVHGTRPCSKPVSLGLSWSCKITQVRTTPPVPLCLLSSPLKQMLPDLMVSLPSSRDK